MYNVKIINLLSRSTQASLRTFMLLVNSIFPFLYPMKDWGNGRILRGGIIYLKNLMRYRKADLEVKSLFPIKFKDLYPCLVDRFEPAGFVSKHYFWQDLWAARKLFTLGVQQHYDIGSRLDGFIAHCLTFTEVVMLDIRPLPIHIPGLVFQETNCINMKQISDGSLMSLSSLHAVEHFGLGRYGDPIDPLGHEKVIMEIQRVIGRNGHILFSVPIGIQRLEFDGHRIFDPLEVVRLFDNCNLKEFSYIDDENTFHENIDINNCPTFNFGCGLYYFQKR